jgi:hypothetical protein
MEATVRATCPQCKTVLRIPAQWVGQAVKCKKCGALVRSKARADDTPSNGLSPNTAPMPVPTAATTPLPPAPPQPNAFNFNDGSESGGSVPWPAKPAPAPAPVPQLDANGFPIPVAGYPQPAVPSYPAPPAGYPVPPAYPYALPPGYPYPMPPGYAPPPGYPAPAPAAGYPYPMPTGYPQPAQHGYAPPGYAYPQPVAPGAASAPNIVLPPAPVPGANGANSRGPTSGAPVPPSNEFKMDPAARAATGVPAARRRPYSRGTNKSKYVWIGVCLFMTAGLIAAGIFGSKYLQNKFADKTDKKEPHDAKTDPGQPAAGPGADKSKAAAGAFPRRLLFVSITKYMYLNPLTQAQPGAPDRTKPAALRLAYDWRIPTDPTNNQVYVLSDSTTGPDARLPMKGVVQETCQEFFKSSRSQDRICVYFGGHAIEKDGKAYLAPMEAELDGEDWEKSVIPLDGFYAEMDKCKATQKVVIWDVCRYNPERGRVRPGSEPMSEGLYKALTTPPEGIQVVTTCKPGENALEFTALRPDGFSGAVYSGSSFLESMKFVAEPKNKRMAASTPTPADPLPITEWTKAIEKRTAEMSDLGEKSGSGGKQTVALSGGAPGTLAPPNPEERVAARFEFPHPPKGASPAEIKAVEREFYLPPLKPGLGEVGLADFPFPADVMKEYAGDTVPLDVMLKDKEKYRFRAAVIEALNKIREKWTPGAGVTRIRSEVVGPLNDKIKLEVKKEQEEWAIGIIQLEQNFEDLKKVAPMRDAEPKRWQAHYDFAFASVQARLAYMNEYNKLLGNLITETLPPLDPKLGQDGYVLVASDSLKSGKDVKKWAEDAQALFQEIAVKYKGTPWAIQAKQEKSVAIGLNWKAASLKKE